MFDELNFNKINLKNFISIRGKFAKNLYRLLISYQSAKADNNGFKYVKFSKDEFKKLMGAPKIYKATDLDRFIIKPAILKLDKIYFKKIIFEKRLARETKGAKKSVASYLFKFIPNESELV